MRYRTMFVSAIVLGISLASTSGRGYDGWHNNIANPSWGTAGSHLVRKSPAAYSDGTYQYITGRPNERLISWKAMTGPSGLPSYVNRTAFLALFGQFVSLEMLKGVVPGCPRELTPIKVPQCDPVYDPGCTGTKKVPFLRAKFDTKTGQTSGTPREQLNLVSSYIDGGVIYSNSKVWADTLRTHADGKLKTLNDRGLWPQLNSPYMNMLNLPPARDHHVLQPERQWLLGDARLFQHPATLSFGVIFMRYHNHLAERFKTAYPDWDDDMLFEHTRKWIIAIQQNIYAYDFYPAFSGDTLDAYSGYKDYVHPGVTSLFQAAAFRFGHTLVTPGFYRRDGQCNYLKTTNKTGVAGNDGVRMCNTWFAGDEAFEYGIEPILLGMASQIAEREDHILNDDVNGKLFGPMQHTRRDLVAVNIKRGRDNGLPDYNTCRKAMGLPAITNWSDINPQLYVTDPAAIEALKDVYDDKIEHVDAFVGGLFESRPSGPGPLFLSIIKDHFTRVRDGDRFWFENTHNELFTSSEIIEIKRIGLYDIILNVTNITASEIQQDIFFFKDGDPCPQPRQLNGSDMEACNGNQGNDFFSGSEWTFIITMCAIGVLPFLTVGLAELLSGVKRASGGTLKKGDDADINLLQNTTGLIFAEEWQGKDVASVLVQPVLKKDKATLTVLDKNAIEIRTINFNKTEKVVTRVDSNSRGVYLLIQDNKEYDLVLKFRDPETRMTFSDNLSTMASDHKLAFEEMQLPLKEMFKSAETKQTRKAKVELFLKDVFAQVVNNDKKDQDNIAGKKTKQQNDQIKQVFEIEMSRKEFSEALALTEESLFVEQMFAMVDSDGNGYVSFREFLDVLILMSKGSDEDKMRMMFDMYDLDGSGEMDKQEFTTMIRSMVEMANNNLSSEEVDALLSSMFALAGLESKEELTFEDFLKLMSSAGKDNEKPGNGHTEGTSDRLGMVLAKQNTTLAERAIGRAVTASSRAKVQPDQTDRPRTAGPALNVDVKETVEERGLIKHYRSFEKYMETNRRQIFFLTVFFSVTIALFVERSVYYSVSREHVGLRRMAGYGVSTTRGAASAMSFTYSVTLLTMCRNTISVLMQTRISNYIPLESALEFHKIAAWTSVLVTMLHICGHVINFYHMSTQPPDFVECVFKNALWFRSDFLPTFDYYLFQTVPGLTGVFLILVLVVMSVFSTSWARAKVYTVFWTVHTLYIALFVLLIIHGSSSFVQEPWFHYFFLFPAVLFTIDKLISASRRSVSFTVQRVEHLPNGVTELVLKKPQSFSHVAGQWCRIACTAFNSNEYHPFTITAAPHEDHLTFHIRALGPWTFKIREMMDPYASSFPKMYVDGPFGGVSEDWYKYDMAIFVGGGIGVTPYAAILKHITYQRSISTRFFCKKVFFFWVCKNQNQFEWMIDIVRDVEQSDPDQYIETHLFVTQFFGAHDLRTVMMYMCEKQFVSLSEKSMFTGLRAPTHFGRPDFHTMLTNARNSHRELKKVGVFACGPVPLTKAVGKVCDDLNSSSMDARFEYFSENFG